MNSDQFRLAAKQLIDYIADYIEGLRGRIVVPDVEPGYINDLVPEKPPEDGEPWINLFNDIEPVIMRGVCIEFFFLVPFFSMILFKIFSIAHLNFT